MNFQNKSDGDATMKKLSIGVIDLVARGRTQGPWARTMNANLAGIMAQAVAAWCEQEGHSVAYACYVGLGNPAEGLPEKLDLAIISSFSQGGQLAYALSAFLRSRGTLTVLGGPHARCYPQDAQKYFDYVVGFADKTLIQNILQDCSQHRPLGIHVSAERHPSTLPSVQERWKFIEIALRKAPFKKSVPMIGSLGCPYRCSFCIDSVIPYQSLDFDVIKADLRFILGKFKHPVVGWHDPNFGIRFDDCLSAIEEAVPPGRMSFVAESSLSLLSEPHVKRLQKNGFKALLPGIESWRDFGNKSKTGKNQGMDKVRQVSEQVNMILRYIPYVQTNFVFGLDADEGSEPFELTRRFLDMTPGIYPANSLLTAYGQASPLNLEYQEAGRVLPIPFYFLDSSQGMNIKPKNYTWKELYDNMVSLTRHNTSYRYLLKNSRAIPGFSIRFIQFIRFLGWFNRLKFFIEIRRRLDEDPQVRSFFEGDTTEIPQFYVEKIRRSLGPLWDWLPEGALYHDPNAYLKSQKNLSSVDASVDWSHTDTPLESSRAAPPEN